VQLDSRVFPREHQALPVAVDPDTHRHTLVGLACVQYTLVPFTDWLLQSGWVSTPGVTALLH